MRHLSLSVLSSLFFACVSSQTLFAITEMIGLDLGNTSATVQPGWVNVGIKETVKTDKNNNTNHLVYLNKNGSAIDEPNLSLGTLAGKEVTLSIQASATAWAAPMTIACNSPTSETTWVEKGTSRTPSTNPSPKDSVFTLPLDNQSLNTALKLYSNVKAKLATATFTLNKLQPNTQYQIVFYVGDTVDPASTGVKLTKGTASSTLAQGTTSGIWTSTTQSFQRAANSTAGDTYMVTSWTVESNQEGIVEFEITKQISNLANANTLHINAITISTIDGGDPAPNPDPVPTKTVSVVSNKALDSIPAPIVLPVPVSTWTTQDKEGALTLECWVQPSLDTQSSPIIQLGQATLALEQGIPTIKDSSGKTLLSADNTPFSAQSWHHIALSSNGMQTIIYIDGVESNKLAGTTIKNALATAWRGIILPSDFKGKRDEIRLWSTILTGLNAPITEITDVKTPTDFILEGPLSMGHPKYASLIGCWKLDGDFRDSKWTEFADKTNSPYKTPYQSVTPTDAQFSIVTDNNTFRYMLLSTYVRAGHIMWNWPERAHLINNSDLIYIGSASANEDGTIKQIYPNNNVTESKGLSLIPQEADKTNILEFKGKDSFMKVGTGLLETEDLGKFTIESTMMFTEDAQSVTLFENNHVSMQIQGKSGAYRVKIRIDNDEWESELTGLTSNTWFNLAVVRVNNTTTFYLDTKPITTTQTTPITITSLGTTHAAVAKGLVGKIDDMRIWIWDARPYLGTPLGQWPYHWIVAHWGNSNVPGRDTASFTEHLRVLREMVKGVKGIRIRLDISGGTGGWKTMFASPTAIQTFATSVADLVRTCQLDGIDLDFEWPTNNQWVQYGNVVKAVHEASPDMIFSISPHKVSYQLPADKMQYVDYFTFQTYGPSIAVNTYDSMKEAYKLFKKQGYPDSKILLSAPFQGTPGNNNNNIKMYRDMVIAGCPEVNNPDLDVLNYPKIDSPLHYNGVTTIKKKAKYINTNNLAGFMYWDLGEDVADSKRKSNYFDTRSLLRAATRYTGSTSYPVTLNPFSLDSMGANIPASETIIPLQVQSEGATAWTITSQPNWITATPQLGVGTTKVTLTVNANKKSASRSGIIIFQSSDGQESTFEINQEGASAGYDTWTNDHNIGGLPSSAPTKSYSGDGMSNLEKYALGLDPEKKQPSLGKPKIEKDQFSIEYPANAKATGITLIGERLIDTENVALGWTSNQVTTTSKDGKTIVTSDIPVSEKASQLLRLSLSMTGTATTTTIPCGYATYPLRAKSQNYIPLQVHKPYIYQTTLDQSSTMTLKHTGQDTVILNSPGAQFTQILRAKTTYILEVELAGKGCASFPINVTAWQNPSKESWELTADTVSFDCPALASLLADKTITPQSFCLREAWTLGDIFGVNNEVGLKKGSSFSADAVFMQIENMGLVKFYYTGTAWRGPVASKYSIENIPAHPHDALIISRKAGTNIPLTIMGEALLTPQYIALDLQEQCIGTALPVTQKLKTTGLETSLSESSSSSNSDGVYIPIINTKEKFYFYNTLWRLGTNNSADQGDQPIKGIITLYRRSISPKAQYITIKPVIGKSN
ncbi:MAG: glycosyl hydrolase family 18 protein [Akkermansia sp.]